MAKPKHNPDAGGILIGALLVAAAAGGGFYLWYKKVKKYDKARADKTKRDLEAATKKQAQQKLEADLLHVEQVKAAEDAVYAKTQDERDAANLKVQQLAQEAADAKVLADIQAQKVEDLKIQQAEQEQAAAAEKAQQEQAAAAEKEQVAAVAQAVDTQAQNTDGDNPGFNAQAFKDWTNFVMTVWGQMPKSIPDPPGLDPSSCNVLVEKKGSFGQKVSVVQTDEACLHNLKVNLWTSDSLRTSAPLEFWKTVNSPEMLLFVAERMVANTDTTVPAFIYLMAATESPSQFLVRDAASAAGIGIKARGQSGYGNWANWNQARRKNFIANLKKKLGVA